jgi:hypothetical protein
MARICGHERVIRNPAGGEDLTLICDRRAWEHSASDQNHRDRTAGYWFGEWGAMPIADFEDSDPEDLD